MRKFKHIPTGLVYTFEEVTPRPYEMAKKFRSVTDGMEIFVGFVIGCKDWEEVKPAMLVQPQWEIKSFIVKKQCMSTYTKGRIFTRDGVVFKSTNTISRAEDFFLKDSENFEIHSVKRLSDGVVFTIGDVIGSTRWGAVTSGKNTDPIAEIYIYKNEGDEYPAFKNGDLVLKSKITWQTTIQTAIKKQKLFTTEDGVDIYKGDYHCFIPSLKEKSWKIVEVAKSGDNLSARYHQGLDFSTLEKAEEYRLMNMPCLSIQDIINFAGGTGAGMPCMSRDKFKELVKSKLK